MSRLLISKKGSPQIPLLLAGAVAVLAGFVFLSSGEFEGHSRGNSDFEDMLMNGIPFLFILMGLVSFVGVFTTSKVYINVYDDHIEGAALNQSGFAVQNFHFTKDMQYTVQLDGATVKIDCSGKTYRIKLSAADASEVYHCVMNNMASSRTAPMQRPTYPVKPNPAQQPASRPVSRPASPAPSQPNSAQSILVRCPSCNAPMRIPAGKGTIRLTCPKCKNIFQTKS